MRLLAVVLILVIALPLSHIAFLPGQSVSAQNGLVSSFSKTYRTTTTSTDFHLAIGLAATVHVPEWEVWSGGPVVPARWDIDWQIARAPVYKIFNHDTPGAFLFEDIQFNISDVGKTYTISSMDDDPDFDDFAAFLTNSTDDNIWDAWISPMHPTNNAGGIRCAGGSRGFHFESDVFSGIDVGTDHPGWVIQSVSLTFDEITTSSLVIDYTVDITYGPMGNPELPGAPTDFTLTLSGDNISASWTMGTNADNTTVMRQANRYPADINDGVLAYSGNGTSFIDSGLNIDDNEYHYRAWSQNVEGYSTDYAEGITGGVGMYLLALVVLAVGLTVAMFLTRERMLGFPSTIMWAILGGFAYGESTVAWGDWQYFLFFASLFGMTTFCALAAFGLREKRDSIADTEIERGDGSYVDEAGGGEDMMEEPETQPSKRTQALHARRDARRSGR